MSKSKVNAAGLAVHNGAIAVAQGTKNAGRAIAYFGYHLINGLKGVDTEAEQVKAERAVARNKRIGTKVR